MSGGPDGGTSPSPDALAQDEVHTRPHAYPDDPADGGPWTGSRRRVPDADEHDADDIDEPDADQPDADRPAADQPDADEPHAVGEQSPADVTVELTDEPETTVRDVEPEPERRAVQPSGEEAAYRSEESRASEAYEYPGYETGPNGAGGQYDPGGQSDTGGVPIVPVKGGWEGVRRRHRRQTLTFLAAFLLVIGVGCAAWLTYSGVVPWPFGGKVNAAQSVCTRSKPLSPQQITVRVYNGTNRTGLAASVAAQLKAYGFGVGDTGNDPLEKKLRTPIELRHGDSGDLAALTVQAYLAGKVHDVRDDRQADTVDVVLGPSFAHVRTRREASRALAALAPKLPLTCPAGVTPAPSASASR
jgi:LytR cell envelope-related transcriptional attenuator